MAGELKFALTIDETGGVKTLTATAQAFQNVNNSAATATTPLRTNEQVTKSLGQAAQGTRASLAAMQNTLAIFGGTVAPQVSGAVLLVTSQLTMLKATATATGLSMTTLGIAGAGLATSLYAVSKAIEEYNKMRDAQGQAKDSARNEIESLEARRKKYIELSKTAEMFGTMSRSEMSDLMHGVLDAGSPEEQARALDKWGKRLKEIGAMPMSPDQQNKQEAYQNTLRMFEAKAQGGDAAAREQIYQEAGRQLKEAFANSDSTRPFEPLRQAIIAARDQALAELDKKNPAAPAATNPFNFDTPLRQPNVTSIEKMGFVFSSGMNRSSTDSSRDIATNTRRTYEVLKTIADRAPAANNLSFANQ